MSSAAFCDMCGRSLLEPPQTRHEPPEQPFLPPSTSAADARDIAGMTVADATGKVLGIVRNVVAVNGQGYLVIKPVTIYTSPSQSNEIQSEFMVPWNLIDSIHDVVLLKLMSEKTEPI
jgi:sporulation protein YlmC with PRC-barrel domain